MAIQQSIDSALERGIGPHGASDKALNDALAHAEGALEILRARHADSGLPLLHLPKTRDDLAAIRDTAGRLAQGATDIVLLGTGGSSLGGQTLAQLGVLMAYADRLERFTRWYVQLWAESLGKNGKGTTPVAALGPVDQHSQVQLYLGGPRDKLFTVITVAGAGLGPRMDDDLAKLAGEPDFVGKTIGNLVAAEGRATAETLAKNGCPVRTLHLATLDEETLGELLMHFMLETIIAAHLIGVDAFDQPAVEEGKVLAKKYLTGG